MNYIQDDAIDLPLPRGFNESDRFPHGDPYEQGMRDEWYNYGNYGYLYLDQDDFKKYIDGRFNSFLIREVLRSKG